MYGKLIGNTEHIVNFNFATHLVFEVKSADLPKCLPQHCEITISEYSPERNIPQNSKYWKIVGEIASKTGQSKTVVHNQLLNDYGELELQDGKPIVVVMPASYDYLEDSDMHLSPTGRSVLINNGLYYEYHKLKNSATMTKKQFSRLVEGAEYEKSNL